MARKPSVPRATAEARSLSLNGPDRPDLNPSVCFRAYKYCYRYSLVAGKHYC